MTVGIGIIEINGLLGMVSILAKAVFTLYRAKEKERSRIIVFES